MARKIFRRITKRFLIVPTVLLCLLFLLACLTPYLNPASWWQIGFLGLLLPYLIILLVFCVIFWLFAKPVLALIPFISLCIGWKQINAIFAYHFTESFQSENKADSSIRLITWNVGSMYGTSNDVEKKKLDRDEIARDIKKLAPDIICLQEFNHSLTQGAGADNIGLFKDKYPYYFFSKDYDKRNGFYQSGIIIFSKFPIIDSGKITYPAPIAESFIYAGIVKGNDTFRVYTVHLQSFKFNPADYADMEKIKARDEEALAASKNIFKKMKLAFSRRGIQANTIHDFLKQDKYKSIICGDFNDVPGSYTYFHIRNERQDAFLKKGFGIGRTYLSLAPTLRIDYILPDKNFNVLQFDMIDEGLSDHFMLVADLSIKK
ncbi:MAG: endonuclease/exonuclease/phosphatase family protein [Chitinophagaceae bacterium]|jgi:endonuclease/exonuclease/phosphatase family metal-dependent hydrolase|nr:endonuclease/exonuclease/phosphatase family protein [Chitinophagaceae bacterium]